MNLKNLASWGISLLLVLAIIFFIDIGKVAGEITSFGLMNSLYFILVFSATFVFRALKWHYLVKPFAKISFRESFHITNVSFLANNLLPARLGELLRAYLLAKKTGIGKVKAFSTVIVDRITDGIALVGLFAAAFLLMSEVPQQLKDLAVLPIAVFIALLAMFYSPEKTISFLEPLIARIPFLKNKMKWFLSEAIIGGRGLRGNLKSKLIIWGSGAAVWLLHIPIFLLVSDSMGIALTAEQTALLIAFIGFGVMIPSAPSYIGTFEAVFVLFFAAFGMDLNQAVAMAVLIHVLEFISTLFLGAYSLNRLGMSWKTLSGMKVRIKFNGGKKFNGAGE